jgi:predicted RNA-binding Zn-ribbon protein involved in translation (DUF1610 family)
MSLNNVIDEINNLEHFQFYQCSACGQKVRFHVLQIKHICPICGAESKVRGFGSIGSEIQDVIDAVLEWAGKGEEFEAVMSRYRSIANDKHQ